MSNMDVEPEKLDQRIGEDVDRMHRDTQLNALGSKIQDSKMIIQNNWGSLMDFLGDENEDGS